MWYFQWAWIGHAYFKNSLHAGGKAVIPFDMATSGK